MRRMRDQWFYLLATLMGVVAVIFSIAYLAKTVGSKKQSEAFVASTESQPETASLFSPALTETAKRAPLIGSSGQGGQYCSAAEYRGMGVGRARVSKAEWTAVRGEFHWAKARLSAWLKTQKLDENTLKKMTERLQELRIERPPTPAAPDLAWRGIGALMEDAKGHQVVRIGGGFLGLAAESPKRARFELVRLMAQVWSTCEGELWKPTMQCLGVAESQTCAEGSYSDAGWAVSTAIAAVVAPPPCTIQAFAAPEQAACLTALGGRSIASAKGASK